MYCKNCGNEVKASARFCSKCGMGLMQKSEEQKYFAAVVKAVTDRKKLNMGIIVGIVIMLALLCVIFYPQKVLLSEEEISELIRNEQITTLTIGGNDTFFHADEIEVASIERDKESGYHYVTCDIAVSNAKVEADVQYDIIIGSFDEEWYIAEYGLVEIIDIRPLQGTEEPKDMIEGTIQSYYPDIDWAYQYDSAFRNVLNYDFPITWNLSERNTDLENKKDCLIYNYSFDTYTAHVTGEVKFDYEFINSGIWQSTNIDHISSNIDWNLEGTWSFDIYTYYVDVSIVDIDFQSGIASIKRRGSAFYGAGSEEVINVGFVESNGCLYFDTFVIPREGMWGTEHEITITAKLDDMYYQCPGMFSGSGPYDMSIGGKSG